MVICQEFEPYTHLLSELW